MKICPAMLIAVSVLAGAALADETPPPPAPPLGETATSPAPQPDAQAAEADDQKVVCRKEEAMTGSRLGTRKICRTVAEWRRISESAKQTVQEIQTKDTRGPPGS